MNKSSLSSEEPMIPASEEGPAVEYFFGGIRCSSSQLPLFRQRDFNEDEMRHLIFDCLSALIKFQKVKKTLKNASSKVFFTTLAAIASASLEDTIIAMMIGDASTEQENEPLMSTLLSNCFPGKGSSYRPKDWLPAHWAGLVGSEAVNVRDLHELLKNDPMLIKKIDCESRKATPAHYAAASRLPSISIVKTMASAAPRMAHVRDAEGRQPLHYAAIYSDSPEMIECLLQLNPSATAVTDFKLRQTPLMHLIKRTDLAPKMLDMVHRLVEVDPQSVLLQDIRGDTALHYACISKRADRQLIVEALLQASSAAAAISNISNNFPIHAACMSSDTAALDVTNQLMAAFKVGAMTENAKGVLPMHVAAHRSNADTVKALHAAYPKAVTVDVMDYGTPIHQAATRNDVLGVDVIRTLHEIHPEGIQMPMKEGAWLPMHSSCLLGSFSVIKMVHSLYPAAIRHRINSGELPLHIMLRSPNRNFLDPLSEDAEALRYVLRGYPTATQVTSEGSQRKETPYTMSVRLDLPVYVRRLLLIACPASEPAELHRLNYEARRGAMYVAFAAVPADVTDSFAVRLRALAVGEPNSPLLRQVFEYL